MIWVPGGERGYCATCGKIVDVKDGQAVTHHNGFDGDCCGQKILVDRDFCYGYYRVCPKCLNPETTRAFVDLENGWRLWIILQHRSLGFDFACFESSPSLAIVFRNSLAAGWYENFPVNSGGRSTEAPRDWHMA